MVTIPASKTRQARASSGVGVAPVDASDAGLVATGLLRVAVLLVVTALLGVALPAPTAFTARTSTVYAVLGSRPVTVPVTVAAEVAVASDAQVRPPSNEIW
jgi:hypothetical protein